MNMKFLLCLLPLSLFASEPEEFYFRGHEYIKFSEHCTIHSPECRCNDYWHLFKAPDGWEIEKIPYRGYNMFDL